MPLHVQGGKLKQELPPCPRCICLILIFLMPCWLAARHPSSMQLPLALSQHSPCFSCPASQPSHSGWEEPTLCHHFYFKLSIQKLPRLLWRNKDRNTNCCNAGESTWPHPKKKPCKARQEPRGWPASAPVCYCFGNRMGDAAKTTLWLHAPETRREAPDGLWTGNDGCSSLAL